MLKIRALKIEVNTTNGLFGAEYKFNNGLNIIRGDNKRLARLNLIRHILTRLDYVGKKSSKLLPDPSIVFEFNRHCIEKHLLAR